MSQSALTFVQNQEQMNSIIEEFRKELEQEAKSTRRLLALVPFEKAMYAPHQKSMKMKDLAIHIADIPGWISHSVHHHLLDFAETPYNPTSCESTEELLAIFDAKVDQAQKDLAWTSDAILDDEWVMRNGEQVLMKLNKYGVIRHSFGQMIHHRAQLGVYLRTLDIPLPGVYGPTADEMYA